MKASEFVAQIQALIAEHGDLEVLADANHWKLYRDPQIKMRKVDGASRKDGANPIPENFLEVF